MGETKCIFRDCGLCLYNDIVLLESGATAAMRAASVFNARRKVVKVHQNVLVFYKGDIKTIKDIYTNQFRWADLDKFK